MHGYSGAIARLENIPPAPHRPPRQVQWGWYRCDLQLRPLSVPLHPLQPTGIDTNIVGNKSWLMYSLELLLVLMSQFIPLPGLFVSSPPHHTGTCRRTVLTSRSWLWVVQHLPPSLSCSWCWVTGVGVRYRSASASG